MADYILLTNPEVCPYCRCKGRVNHFTNCPSCGMLLFLRPINFAAWEDDGGIRSYYLFDRQYGWMHRDQVIVRREAQIANPNIITPEPNRRFTPEQIAGRKGPLTKQARQKILARANAK